MDCLDCNGRWWPVCQRLLRPWLAGCKWVHQGRIPIKSSPAHNASSARPCPVQDGYSEEGLLVGRTQWDAPDIGG